MQETIIRRPRAKQALNPEQRAALRKERCVPRSSWRGRSNLTRHIKVTTRKQLVEPLRKWYRRAVFSDCIKILDEFFSVTGYILAELAGSVLSHGECAIECRSGNGYHSAKKRTLPGNGAKLGHAAKKE